MKDTAKPLLAALLLGLAAAAPAWAGALDSLERFVRSAKAGRADFTQVVTVPAKDGQAARSKTSSGTFEFQRPDRFKFIYRKPFEQAIVADGQTLWLHDVDLNQVTARRQSQVLGQTPAALIASSIDLKQLQADFNLQAAPDKDGLEWVSATPKTRDGQLQTVRVGFEPSSRGGELKALEIVDSFGQRSLMTFGKLEINPPLAADAFQFKPPAGADVIRQ